MNPDWVFVGVGVLNYHRRSIRVGSSRVTHDAGGFPVGPALHESTVVSECAVE
jgi:hypothetical protein